MQAVIQSTVVRLQYPQLLEQLNDDESKNNAARTSASMAEPFNEAESSSVNTEAEVIGQSDIQSKQQDSENLDVIAVLAGLVLVNACHLK